VVPDGGRWPGGYGWSAQDHRGLTAVDVDRREHPSVPVGRSSLMTWRVPYACMSSRFKIAQGRLPGKLSAGQASGIHGCSHRSVPARAHGINSRWPPGRLTLGVSSAPGPGRAWGARGGWYGSRWDVSPGQMAFHQIVRLACVFDFGAPSRIRTCAHGSGVQSRIQPPPAGTRHGRLAWGAYGAREIVMRSSAACGRCARDPKGHALH
jgi:hypothetical protein